MPTKKERLVELERRAEEEGQRITELENKVAELEAKLKNAWLIPTTNPINIPSIWPTNSNWYCMYCGQWYYPLGSHNCPKNNNPIKITCTTTTNTKKDGGV